MLRMIKRIFFPSVTDNEVKAINAKSLELLEDTSKTAKRHKELLEQNGFSLRIYIASGGDKHGQH
jgi:hypothetical protein